MAGSLSWCLQTAGAEKHAIDETTLTFPMPEGDVNINAQFVADSGGSGTGEGAPKITSFIIGNASGAVNNDTRVITIVLPCGTDLRNVVPVITGQNIRKIGPASAARVDLRSPRTYKVTGQDGSRRITLSSRIYRDYAGPIALLRQTHRQRLEELHRSAPVYPQQSGPAGL